MGRQKGYKVSEETKKKIGKANSVALKGNTPWNKGKKMPKEMGEKRSITLKGRKTGRASRTVFKKGHPGMWTNKKRSDEVRKKMSESHKKRFKNKEVKEKTNRFTFEYKEWRRMVFERDNFTCYKCGCRGGRLNAHHKKQFAFNLEKRLDVDNGETLCEKCHKKVFVRRRNSKIGESVFIHEDPRRILYDFYNGEYGLIESVKIVSVEDVKPIGDHFHKNKEEIFFLATGEFLELVLGEKITYYIPAPYKIVVKRGVYHKFICSPGSILIGLATSPFDPNDEIKIIT